MCQSQHMNDRLSLCSKLYHFRMLEVFFHWLSLVFSMMAELISLRTCLVYIRRTSDLEGNLPLECYDRPVVPDKGQFQNVQTF